MFQVGQRVICVRPPRPTDYGEVCAVKGVVYTVRNAAVGVDGPLIRVEEIVNRPRKYFGGVTECWFMVTNFRPVDERRLDVFRSALEPVKTVAGQPFPTTVWYDEASSLDENDMLAGAERWQWWDMRSGR